MARCFHLALWGKSGLCVPACPGAAACWGQKKQNQEEEEHLACHAALPGSPTCGRAGFTRVEFKESLQRQLFGLPEYTNHSPPSPASSSPIAQAGIFLGLSRLPAARLRCAPGSLGIPPGTAGKASLSRGRGLGSGRGGATVLAGEGGPLCVPWTMFLVSQQAVTGQSQQTPQQYTAGPSGKNSALEPLCSTETFPDLL